MHPGIRIICFLVFVACLSRASAGQLFLGLSLLFLLYLYAPVDFLSRAFIMLSRLRWFFLSMLVLYFWMTPENSQFNSLGYLFSFIPSGIVLGMSRIFSLVLVVLAVSYLLANLEREQLIAAIYWLVMPLAFVGLQRKTLALRLMMGMRAVEQLASAPRFKTEKTERKNLYHKISDSLEYYYQYTLSCAEENSYEEYTFDCLPSPAIWQWGAPIGLGVLFLLASVLDESHYAYFLETMV